MAIIDYGTPKTTPIPNYKTNWIKTSKIVRFTKTEVDENTGD